MDLDRAGVTSGHRVRLTPAPGPLAVLPVTFLVVLLVVPLGAVVARSASPAALAVLASPAVWRIAAVTTAQAVVSTALALAMGLPLAYALYRLALPGRRVMLGLLTVPFVLPTVVTGMAMRQVLPGGWVGGWPAVVVAHLVVNLVVVTRVVGLAWEGLEPRELAAARSLGASRWVAFRTVELPALRSAIASASVLVFLFCFTSFGIVVVLGGPPTVTLEVEIYRRAVTLLDLPGAAAVTILQLALVVGMLVLVARVPASANARRRRATTTRSPLRGGDAAWAAAAVAVIGAVGWVVVAVPVGSLRVSGGWGLDWWRALPDIDAGTTRATTPWDSVGVSLRTALVAAVVAVVVGVMAACAVAYADRRGRILDAIATLPLGTSAVTVGLGLLLASIALPVDLRGTWVVLPLAHALVAVPLVVRAVVPSLRQIDDRLRAVAATSGASRWRTWWDVDRPLLMPAVSLAVALSLAVSLGEFGATAFLARSDAPTIPVQIVRLLGRPGAQSYGAAMALATILLILVVAIVALVERRALVALTP